MIIETEPTITKSKKNELAALLVELSVQETHNALNKALDNKNKADATKLISIEKAIDTILDYLAE